MIRTVRLLVKEDFDLEINHIVSIWILNAAKEDTKENEYLVCVLMDGNDRATNLDNPNTIILNLDENKNGFKLRKYALKFKRLLERDICDTSKQMIFIDDLMEEAIMSFQHKTSKESTMTDMRNIFIEEGKIVDKTEKKKTRELH